MTGLEGIVALESSFHPLPSILCEWSNDTCWDGILEAWNLKRRAPDRFIPPAWRRSPGSARNVDHDVHLARHRSLQILGWYVFELTNRRKQTVLDLLIRSSMYDLCFGDTAGNIN